MKVKRVDKGGKKVWRFWCPGCEQSHAIGEGWTFNGDHERPTFTPSILVRSGHYMDGHDGDCWCTYNAKHPDNPSGFKCYRCHSYVTDGRIQYLIDCTHAFAGKTVDMQDIE